MDINPYQSPDYVLPPTVKQAGKVTSHFIWSSTSPDKLDAGIFWFSPCLLYSFITDNSSPLTLFLETYGSSVQTFTLKFASPIIRGVKNNNTHTETLLRSLLGIDVDYILPLGQWLDDMVFLDSKNKFLFRTETDVVSVTYPGVAVKHPVGVINIRTKEKYYRHIPSPPERGTAFLAVSATQNDDLLFKRLCEEADKNTDDSPLTWHDRARKLLLEQSRLTPTITYDQKPLSRAQLLSWVDFYKRITQST